VPESSHRPRAGHGRPATLAHVDVPLSDAARDYCGHSKGLPRESFAGFRPLQQLARSHRQPATLPVASKQQCAIGQRSDDERRDDGWHPNLRQQTQSNACQDDGDLQHHEPCLARSLFWVGHWLHHHTLPREWALHTTHSGGLHSDVEMQSVANDWSWPSRAFRRTAASPKSGAQRESHAKARRPAGATSSRSLYRSAASHAQVADNKCVNGTSRRAAQSASVCDAPGNTRVSNSGGTNPLSSMSASTRGWAMSYSASSPTVPLSM